MNSIIPRDAKPITQKVLAEKITKRIAHQSLMEKQNLIAKKNKKRLKIKSIQKASKRRNKAIKIS